jgi:hypothetical protein
MCIPMCIFSADIFKDISRNPIILNERTSARMDPGFLGSRDRKRPCPAE